MKIIKLLFLLILISCGEKNKDTLGSVSSFSPLGEGVNINSSLKNSQYDVSALFSTCPLKQIPSWSNFFSTDDGQAPFAKINRIIQLAVDEKIPVESNNEFLYFFSRVENPDISQILVSKNKLVGDLITNQGNDYLRFLKENDQVYFIIKLKNEVYSFHYQKTGQSLIISQYKSNSELETTCLFGSCQHLRPYQNNENIPQVIQQLLLGQIPSSDFKRIKNLGDFYENI